MEPHSEDRLFEDFRRTGDARALATLFDRTAKDLLRLALHVSGDLTDAEDLVQETFLTAIRSARSYRPEGRVRAWLCGILQNRARRLRKVRRRRSEAIDHEPPDPSAADGLATASAAELRERVRAALDRMVEPYRTVLALRYRHAFSVQEIAAALERPSNTVQSQLQRGTERLRRMLPGEGALAALAAFSADGLVAVRENVLTAASAAATTGAGIAGVSVKLRVAAAALALLAIGLGVPWAAGWIAPTGASPLDTPSARARTTAGTVTGEVAEPEHLERTGVPPAMAPDAAEDDGPLVPLRVVERGSGRPVPGARVTAFRAVSPIDALPPDEWRAAIDLYAHDLEAFQQHFGASHTADDDGVVHFGVAATRSYMTARAGELYGERWDWDAREIVVAPDRALRVRVVDPGGRPVSDLVLHLGFDPTQVPFPRDGGSRRARTDAAGFAAFPHVHVLADELQNRHGREELFLVSTALGRWPEPVRVFPLGHGALPEAIDVTVPATGAARIRVVDARGRSIARTERFRLDVRVAVRNPARSTSADPDADGITSFRHLPLGVPLRFTAQLGECEAAVEHPGLRRAGEELDIEIRLGDGATTVLGRAVDAGGAAMADTALVARVAGTGRTVRTDTGADGRFRLLLAETGAGPVTLHRVEAERGVGQWDGDVRALGASAALAVPTAGERPVVDVGDVTLGADPVLASGTFRVQPLRLTAAARWLAPTIEEHGDEWRPVATSSVVWHEDGRFTIHGRSSAPALRLRGMSVYAGLSSEALALAPLEFASGADDLHVDVVAASELAIDFRGPPDLLRFDLFPAPGVWPAHDERDLTDLPPATHVELKIVDPRLTAPLIGRLWPGRYRVVVRAAGLDAPILELDDVEIPPGERVRPLRGAPLDLPDRVDLIDVRLVDDSGDPLDGTAWVRAFATGSVERVALERGRLARCVPRGGWNAIATSQGLGFVTFGPETVDPVVVPRVFAVALELRRAGDPRRKVVVPDGTTLRVEIEPALRTTLSSWRVVAELSDALSARLDGESLRLSCRAPGRYVARLVATRDGRDATVCATELDLDADVGRATILVPADALR